VSKNGIRSQFRDSNHTAHGRRLREPGGFEPRTTNDETPRSGALIMKKIIILMALAFSLAAGSVTMTVHSQQATAWKRAVHGSTSVCMFQANPWHGTAPFSI
jgi:hypothetical protein